MIYFAMLRTGTIKIGYTEKPLARFSSLKSQYGGIKILRTMPGGIEEEGALHSRFAYLRIRRTEQFHPGPELLSYLGLPEVKQPSSECKPAGPAVAVPVVLPVDHWAALKKQAHETGRSASAIIRDLVTEHLKRAKEGAA